MKDNRKINKILNYILLVVLMCSIVTCVLDEISQKTHFNRRMKADDLYTISLINESKNKSMELLNSELAINYFNYDAGGNFPVFYDGKAPKTQMIYYGNVTYQDSTSVGVYNDKFYINYEGKNININNKIKNLKGYSPTVYIPIKPDFLWTESDLLNIRAYIPIFPLHNDVYALVGLAESQSDDEFSTSNIDLNRHSYFGIYPSSGIARYALVNLTSNEPAKMINVDTSSYKVIDRKKSKLEKKLDNAKIKYECCYEVGDTYQIAFKNIENSELKKMIKRDEGNDNSINISIKKKDIDKFITFYTGGDK